MKRYLLLISMLAAFVAANNSMEDVNLSEWQKYKEEKAKGHILLPDTIRFICGANDMDPEKIGRHFLEVLPRICPK